ncbi:hypothetical protein [Novilysobacter selenitireducens]|uniref:TniQ protein n=1 Tax=Novilysobacter selenitireducens TaxID=2872639 RepID=A0ABS7T5H0_9GAMM|nr:hypothetical protein [Lysobacter selenitireducens]MBZ4039125.1 hypothetical protein [Lysobacter selenitireducens]
MNAAQHFQPSDLRAPEPFETLSSYLCTWRATRGITQHKFLTQVRKLDPAAEVALAFDPDYPDRPGWAAVVSEVTGIEENILKELGQPAGPWHLSPPCRKHACLECLSVYGPPSKQARSKQWTYATYTTCHIHGLPLVEVPAVGWGWMELRAAERRKNIKLMLNPAEAGAALEVFWSRLDPQLRNAISFAEMIAWLVPSGPCGIRDVLSYLEVDEEDVWADVLVFLCSPWSHYRGAPLALRALPRTIWTQWNRNYFGNYDHPPLYEPPTLGYFCNIASPAQRRACVLSAYSVLQPERFREQVKDDLPGWRHVMRHTPRRAFKWLESQAQNWPTRWQREVTRWARDLRVS